MGELGSSISGNLRLSVIIPFQVLHASALRECLRSLTLQTLARSDYEVILVNAESDSTFDACVKGIADEAQRNCNLHYFRIDRRGRAGARNYGISLSRANVLLLYSSDFIATPELLREHLRLHGSSSDRRIVGIGPAAFPPWLQITPFMRWLEGSGELFGTSFLLSDRAFPDGFFYGANASIRKDFLAAAGPFNEMLPYHAVDDQEMTQRLLARGMKTVFLPKALAYHNHEVKFEERWEAVREAGESAAMLYSKRTRFAAFYKPLHAFKVWATVLKVLAALCEAEYSLLRRKKALYRYYHFSMAQAWVEGYGSWSENNGPSRMANRDSSIVCRDF